MGYCKYYKQIKQVSYDSGATWQNVVPAEYRKGELYENSSIDCGYIGYLERWVPIGTTCVEADKYYILAKEYSTDNGETWTRTEETKLGPLIETESFDCIKIKAEYLGGTTDYILCDSSPILHSGNTMSLANPISAMTSARIGNCVTRIGDNAFYSRVLIYCSDSSLTSLTLSSGVTYVGEKAFYDNNNLKYIDGWNQLTYAANYAFFDCYNLENEDIPSGLTSINQGTFGRNYKLSAATIPSGVTIIDIGAFTQCSGLTSVTIPNTVTTIKSMAFYKCSSIPTVFIPESVTLIETCAFQDCTSLTSVTISSGMSCISASAFCGCHSLQEITCHAVHPPLLENDVFKDTNNCPIYVPCESVLEYQEAWSEYSERIRKISGSCDFKVYIRYVNSPTLGTEIQCSEITKITSGETTYGGRRYEITAVTIGECATEIGDSAFDMIDNSTASTLSAIVFTTNNVTTVGNDAFRACRKLTGFCEFRGNWCYNAEANFTSVGLRAFQDCESLNYMNISGLTTLPAAVFLGCSGLRYVTFNSGLTYIGASAFYGCSNLDGIRDGQTYYNFRIPDTVTYIGAQAFSGCYSLISFEIPSGVTDIGEMAFYGCSGFNAIKCNAVTPPTLGNDAFKYTNDCPIFVPCNSIDTYKSATGWSDYADRIFGIRPCYAEKYVQIGETECVGTDEYYKTIKYVSDDGGYSWHISEPIVYGIGDLKLANSYKCGGTEGIAYIASYTSGRTYSADCITLNNKITTAVTKYNDYSYTEMTSVDIGKCVTEIGHRAFINCSALTAVTVNAETPPTLEPNPYGGGSGGQFDGTTCPIYVPCSSYVAYKTAWSEYANRIQGIPPCETQVKYQTNLSSGECNSSYTIESYEVKDYYGHNQILYVILGNCVNRIGTYAFYKYYDLTSVTLSNSVTVIGEYAFNQCSSLRSIDIPSGVTSIGQRAFLDCYSLQSITCNAVTPPTLGNGALNNTNNCPIYVPAESVNAYKSSWATYASRIQAIPT